MFARTALKSLTAPLDLHMYTTSMNSSRPNAPSGTLGVGGVGSPADATTGEPSLLEYYVDARTGMITCWRDAGLVERIYALLGLWVDLPLLSDRGDRSHSTTDAPDRSLTCSAHTQKYLHLFDLLLNAERPLLVAGASGVGKSAFLQVRRISTLNTRLILRYFHYKY